MARRATPIRSPSWTCRPPPPMCARPIAPRSIMSLPSGRSGSAPSARATSWSSPISRSRSRFAWRSARASAAHELSRAPLPAARRSGRCSAAAPSHAAEHRDARRFPRRAVSPPRRGGAQPLAAAAQSAAHAAARAAGARPCPRRRSSVPPRARRRSWPDRRRRRARQLDLHHRGRWRPRGLRSSARRDATTPRCEHAGGPPLAGDVRRSRTRRNPRRAPRRARAHRAVGGAGDLALALRRAASTVQGSTLPTRSIAVATDGQRTSWAGASRITLPLALLVPSGDPPPNRAVLSAVPEPSRWTPRGSLVARVETRDSVGYRIVLGDRTLSRGATGRGEPIALRAGPPERGWQAGRVELEPDDFPADDARHFALWIGPPPLVTVDASAGTFAATAVSALVADGRAAAGSGVRIASADAATSLPALIVPPTDQVRLGAANRELERLGVPWRYGTIERGSLVARGGRLDNVAVTERYRLVRAGVARSDTLATAGAEPWVVAGPGYVLLGSRLDPAATQLPVRAPFVPWLADMLALRLGAPAGDVGGPVDALPGRPIRLPAGAETLESVGGSRRSVTADLMDAPDERGVWFVLRGGRRVGAVVVNAPPEESALERWSAAALGARLGGARARTAATGIGWVGDTYAAGSTRPAGTPLLVLALLLLAAEAVAVRTSRPTAA